jgi:hypothetical protein
MVMVTGHQRAMLMVLRRGMVMLVGRVLLTGMRMGMLMVMGMVM